MDSDELRACHARQRPAIDRSIQFGFIRSLDHELDLEMSRDPSGI
jgi:hypothetical protein